MTAVIKIFAFTQRVVDLLQIEASSYAITFFEKQIMASKEVNLKKTTISENLLSRIKSLHYPYRSEKLRPPRMIH